MMRCDETQALDLFNTAIVTPVYYVMFTTLTILASAIMFRDYEQQTPRQMLTELCGFATIMAGIFLLHVAKDTDSIRRKLVDESAPQNEKPRP